MKVDKVINNNLVRAFDGNKEVLLMGCGLGYKKKVGESIDDKKIEKIYSIKNENTSSKLITLLSEIPLEHIQTANEIISYAKYSLGRKLDDNIYITLTDHISFAIERLNKGMCFHNALLWEIKKFYNHEFLIGKEALSIVKKRLGIDLSEDEAGSIALHIVNAETETSALNLDKTLDMTKLIQNILNIVKYYYKIELDEYSIYYERFITHLKFFSQRIFAGEKFDCNDTVFYETIKNQYKDTYVCTEKIAAYIENEFDHKLTEEEKMYLTLHIRRITTKI